MEVIILGVWLKNVMHNVELVKERKTTSEHSIVNTV